MRAVMVCYQLSNLLLYKHELLLSKCPLTADWLLIRPVWNEISNEPLNYDPIPEHLISHTYISPFCLFPPSISVFIHFTLLPPLPSSSSVPGSSRPSVLTWPFFFFFALCPSLAECNCSGRSEDCVFDMEQYRSTGSGGRCVSCRDNTDGPHCERCRENHYRESAEEPCLPCNCNINGNLQTQNPLLFWQQFKKNKNLIIIHANIINYYFCFLRHEKFNYG